MLPPLVDVHCHLLAGLDDGPKTPDDAVAMCRRAREQGVRQSVALAHQNEEFPDNTPDRIRAAFARLVADLEADGLYYNVVPCAEVMVRPDLTDAWDRGELLSVNDQGKYILLEMPHGLTVELAWVVEEFMRRGVRPILAHAERCRDLLHDPAAVEKLIRAGCLIQVNAGSVTKPGNATDAWALKDWFRRGVAHLIGSDGHSLRRRPPDVADAYHQIVRWTSREVADRVCSIYGSLVLQGMRINVPPPRPAARRWLPKLW